MGHDPKEHTLLGRENRHANVHCHAHALSQNESSPRPKPASFSRVFLRAMHFATGRGIAARKAEMKPSQGLLSFAMETCVA